VNINSDNKLLLSSNDNSFTDKISQMLKDSTCNGCGAPLQYSQPNTGGYIPEKRLQSMLQSDENGEAQDQIAQSTLICQRCFYLKHYNTALNVMLSPDHYISHLSYLKDERALVMCLIDVTDYPSSLFPQLHSILNSVNSTVYIVANKIDLLPDVNKKSLRKVEDFIRSEASGSLRDIAVSKVLFVSAKTGEGIYELTEAVVNEWGNRGNVYLIGCTNVGKSSLFNRLLVTLCGAKPGQVRTMSQVSAPSPTISHWPGTTLGLLRFPLLSYGKRRRLLSRASKMGVRLEDMINEGFHDDVIDTNHHTDQASEEIQEVLADVGLKKKTKEKIKPVSLDVPQNRFWLHDTPGAVNDLQSINYLTTKELKLVLPKKRLSPRTYILKPGMALFIGGMARIDYTEVSNEH
jgi:ribosome biogenesis GTPase A